MRGDGRLYRQKNSKFWWCAYYVRGREQRESTRETDQKRARRFLRHRMDEVGADRAGKGRFIGPQQQRITVNELLANLEADFRLRLKWNPKVQSNMKAVREYMGLVRAVDVTREMVTEMIEHWQSEGYAPASINRRTQLLAQSFKLALRDRKLNSAPFIPRLSEVGNERQGFFERADFEAVLSHLPEYLRDFCRFAFITGWRKGAITGLEWADVGDNVVYLHAVNSKTRKPETVPLTGELREIIDRRRAAQLVERENGEATFSRYVFHNGDGAIGDFRKSWTSACRAAGLTGKLFHDFRRTAARNMIEAGVPQAVAMKITGHRTDSMFRRYAIVNEEQKRDALIRTASYLGAKAEVRKVAVMAAGK